MQQFLPRTGPRAPRVDLHPVRCECVRCGAHVMARGAYTLAGSCGNCGSYELRPLPEPGAPAALTPPPGPAVGRPLAPTVARAFLAA